MTLTCDRSRQQHYANEHGQRYWSVTQVCDAMDPTRYAGIDPDILEKAAKRGTAAHYFFSFTLGALAGLCPAPHNSDPAHAAITRWCEEHKPKVLLVETPSIWDGKNIAGTPEALCEATYTKPDRRVLMIPELKYTADCLPVHRVQLQAYAELVGYRGAKELHLIYLRSDGTYADIEVKRNPTDKLAFLSALNLLNWRMNLL